MHAEYTNYLSNFLLCSSRRREWMELLTCLGASWRSREKLAFTTHLCRAITANKTTTPAGELCFRTLTFSNFILSHLSHWLFLCFEKNGKFQEQSDPERFFMSIRTHVTFSSLRRYLFDWRNDLCWQAVEVVVAYYQLNNKWKRVERTMQKKVLTKSTTMRSMLQIYHGIKLYYKYINVCITNNDVCTIRNVCSIVHCD